MTAFTLMVQTDEVLMSSNVTLLSHVWGNTAGGLRIYTTENTSMLASPLRLGGISNGNDKFETK